MSIQTLHEPLRCTMRVTQSNRTFIELIQQKEGFDTMNAALSKIIEIARPFFSRRSSDSVNKVTKVKRVNKKDVGEFAAQPTSTDVKDFFNNDNSFQL